jgi:hypothetical protein
VKKTPYLTVKQSSLGAQAGSGLFVTEDIDVLPGKVFVLGYFFGKVAMMTEHMLTEYDEDHGLFQSCRKNLIQLDNKFNPVIYRKENSTIIEDVNDRYKVFLVASDCCLLCYANTAAESECNAEIVCPKSRGIIPSNGFEGLDNWLGVIKKPLMRLQLTR